MIQQLSARSMAAFWSEATERQLGAYVARLIDELSPEDGIYRAIAATESGSPDASVRYVDALRAKTQEEHPGIRISLAPEFETAIAVHRFKLQAPDECQCRHQYGPFAEHICSEVARWSEIGYAITPLGSCHGALGPLAFTDGNLVVIDERLSNTTAYAAVVMHEACHRMKRTGHMWLTEDGEWLHLNRDVPTASAKTHLSLLEDPEPAQPLRQSLNEVRHLVEIGRTQASADRDGVGRYIRNMLQYFDDLGNQETTASYPCAAILLGMAFDLLEDREAVDSYLSHLEVMGHDQALRKGQKRAQLRLCPAGETRPFIVGYKKSSEIPAALEGAPARGRDVLISTAHPDADPDGHARRNIAYRRDLSAWKALPWWKRIRTEKPKPPLGVLG
jgi:hypothetical protein